LNWSELWKRSIIAESRSAAGVGGCDIISYVGVVAKLRCEIEFCLGAIVSRRCEAKP